MDAGGDRGRFRLKRFRIFLVLAALAATVLGFYFWQTSRPGPLRLRQVGFADLPGWRQSDTAAALAAFSRSCAVLSARSPQTSMGGKGYGGVAADWLGVCGAARGEPRAFFENSFTPYQLSAGGKRRGLFTGYFEPLIAGSRTRHGAYQVPVYGLPPDLVRVDLSLFSSRFQGEHLAGRLDGHRLAPYATRADINAQGLPNTKILFWSNDAVALFFLHIQGSGRVTFDDGSSERIAYAGDNGRPYTAIGRVLIGFGALARDKVSLASIKDWLDRNPARARAIMEEDQSFVFFEEKPLNDPALGSTGTLGAPLTPRASLAIDPRLNILGAPYYVAAPPVTGLLVGQDTGGAIRGPVRGDVFFGFGEQAAGNAGGMKADGMLYVLLPNALAAKLGKQKDFP